LIGRLADPFRQTIAREISHVLLGREAPIERKPDGLFGPTSVAWRVHGDVATMMIGGLAALLLQMLHPRVLAGVWDHSTFRGDMQGRLQRTARFVAVTTYGDREQAQIAIRHVRAIHDRVRGTLADGTSYIASDPDLLDWVHVTGATCFLAAWRRYAEPAMSRADQDRYFTEMAVVAEALGATRSPHSAREAQDLISAIRPDLQSGIRSQDVLRTLLGQPAPSLLAEPAWRLVTVAAIDLLPAWARRMHGLERPMPTVPFVRVGTWGLARTLRWVLSRTGQTRNVGTTDRG
jgi:uncharacterized protein (DUF2236 family)